MDIPDIATLVAGSTIPLCVGIASLAVGCVLKYQEVDSSSAPVPPEPPAPVPPEPEFFVPRCNDDYVHLKKKLRAGTHSTSVLVQGTVTKADNKGTYKGIFDPLGHTIEATMMKDEGPSAAGKAIIDRTRGNYADISETTFSIPFHLQNKDVESVDRNKKIILTVVGIHESPQFTKILQRWHDKPSTRNNYDILPYGSTIAVLGAARLEDNEITIFPFKVGRSIQSLLPKESNIGSNATSNAASNAASNAGSNSDVTNVLLVVGGVLIVVGVGFFVYKIWKARQYHPGREENRRAVGNRRDGGDDHY